MAVLLSEASDGLQCCDLALFGFRELQAQEALQNGQLGAGDGVPDLQPGVLASQALMEKILGEDPRWQGNPTAVAVCRAPARWASRPRLRVRWPVTTPARGSGPWATWGRDCMAAPAPARRLVLEPACFPAASQVMGTGQQVVLIVKHSQHKSSILTISASQVMAFGVSIVCAGVISGSRTFRHLRQKPLPVSGAPSQPWPGSASMGLPV